MAQWKVTLPREKPQEGKANIAIGVRYDTGTRFESSGAVNQSLALMLVRLCVRANTVDLPKLEAAINSVLDGVSTPPNF